MSREIRYNREGREKLKAGVDALANAVKVTLGPKGRNVIIQKNFDQPVITKDGVTVAKSVFLPDIVENMGAQLVKQVAKRAAELAGDGTTTATVIAQAIVEEGMKSIVAGANPMDIKRGIDLAAKFTVDDLKHQVEVVGDDFDKIEQIGTISANGDKEIGKIIADAMREVGPDGSVSVEGSQTAETYASIEKGMQFNRGYLSHHFVTNQEEGVVEYENPQVVIVNKRISAFPEIAPLLEKAFAIRRPLFLIVQDMEAQPLQALIINRTRAGRELVVVKAPAFGDQQKEILEDIAVLTGATIIGDETGHKLDEPNNKWFGKCKSIKIDKDFTYIFDGAGEQEKIELRVAQLRKSIAAAPSDFVKNQLKARLAKLVGGVAIIHVGATSEVEMKEKKDRVDDALHATRAAVEEGVVIGGGTALLYVAYGRLAGLGSDNPDIKRGIEILRQSIVAPFRVILENAGENAEFVRRSLLSEYAPESGKGYNAATGKFCDLKAEGIIDPFKVTRIAVEHAASIAGMILTTECVISNIEDAQAGQEQLFYQ